MLDSKKASKAGAELSEKLQNSLKLAQSSAQTEITVGDLTYLTSMQKEKFIEIFSSLPAKVSLPEPAKAG